MLDVLDIEYSVMLRAANRILDAKKIEARSKELSDKLAPAALAARDAANVTAAVAPAAGGARGATGATAKR